MSKLFGIIGALMGLVISIAPANANAIYDMQFSFATGALASNLPNWQLTLTDAAFAAGGVDITEHCVQPGSIGPVTCTGGHDGVVSFAGINFNAAGDYLFDLDVLAGGLLTGSLTTHDNFADISTTGDVNGNWFGTLRWDFLPSCQPCEFEDRFVLQAHTSPVPEPASLALLGSALFGGFVATLRRRKFA
jgi:PEP-CTERM motif